MRNPIKYRRFDQLISEVRRDFPLLDLDPADFIKHALYVNALLGVKINQVKERTVAIKNGKGKLPEDFDIFNKAFFLDTYSEIIPMGVLGEEILVSVPKPDYTMPNVNVCIPETLPAPAPGCGPCETHCSDCAHEYQTCMCIPSDHVRTNCNGESMVVFRKYRNHVRKYEKFIPVKLVNSPQVMDEFCNPDRGLAKCQVTIRDGFIRSSGITNGTLYLNYDGLREDEEGNLLVLDHPIINMFYEYYMKSKAIELSLASNQQLNPDLVKIVFSELRIHQNQALSIINSPEFDEIKKAHKALRKAFYNKYYRMFSTC